MDDEHELHVFVEYAREPYEIIVTFRVYPAGTDAGLRKEFISKKSAMKRTANILVRFPDKETWIRSGSTDELLAEGYRTGFIHADAASADSRVLFTQLLLYQRGTWFIDVRVTFSTTVDETEDALRRYLGPASNIVFDLNLKDIN